MKTQWVRKHNGELSLVHLERTVCGNTLWSTLDYVNKPKGEKCEACLSLVKTKQVI